MDNLIDYYEGFIRTDDFKVTIYKEGNVDLLVSLNPHNKFPSEKRFTYSTKTTNENMIRLNKFDLIKACKTLDPQLGTCAFYVAVISRNMESTPYQLSMTRNLMRYRQQLNLLEDGNEITLPTPRENIDILYFYMLPSEDYYIKLRSLTPADVYVKLLDKDMDISSIENIEAPSSSSYNYMARTSTFRFDYEDIATISNITTEIPMLALVAVYFVGSIQDSLLNYTMMLRSHVKHIFLGQKHYGIVQSGQYKYFAVDIVPWSGMLLISANSIGDNTQELSIVVASPCDWELPTITSPSSVHPATELYGSKFIQIDPSLSLIFRPGIWVIGIYSQQTSEFSLFTFWIGDSIIELTADQPALFKVLSTPTRYYIYSPQTSNPLNIHFSSRAHLFPYYITSISKGEDIISNLPNRTNHQWSKASDIDPKSCNNCLYIIAVVVDTVFIDSLNIGFQNESQMEVNITISERNDQTIVLESGYPINSRLLPRGSNVISIPHMTIEDVYLAVSSEAERLEISSPGILTSTWKIELICHNQTRVLKIPRSDEVTFSALSQDELYQNINTYVQIKNPTDVDVKYTAISVPIREYVANMRDSIEFGIGSKASQGIILYSENSGNEDEMIELEFESTLSQRLYYKNDAPILDLGMQAYYWSDNISEISPTGLPVYKTNIFTLYREKVQTTYMWTGSFKEFAKQKSLIFKTSSKTGKFLFLITNPSDESLILQMNVASKLDNLLACEPNFNETFLLQPGKSYTYIIALPGPGAWYLGQELRYLTEDESYRGCNSECIRLSVQDGIDIVGKETNMTEFDISHPYKETIGEGEHIKLVRVSVLVETSLELNISSIFLPGIKAYDYLLIPNENQSLVELTENDTVIFVHFNPVLFYEYNLQDTLVYTVRACDFNDASPTFSNDSCVTLKSEEFYIHMKNETKLELRGLTPGKYLVQWSLSVINQGYLLKLIRLGNDEFKIRGPSQLKNVALPNTPAKESVNNSEEDELLQSSNWNVLSVGGIMLIAVVVVVLVLVKLMLYRQRQRREKQEKEYQKENELADMEDSGEFLSSMKKKEETNS